MRATVQRYAPFAWASTYGVEFNSFVDGDYRAMIAPPAGGFPYRFVATSLGSQCGKGPLAPYDELVRIEAGGYLNLVMVSTSIHTQVVVNALPNPGQVQRLSGLQVWNQVRVLLFTRKFYLSKLAYQSPAANRIAWDGLPGGVQYVNGQLSLTPGTNSGTKLWGIVGYYKNVALGNAFCFVPSASALDVPMLDNNTARASFVNGYTSSTSPPLAETYIAEVPHYDRTTGTTAYNSPHPFFTGRQSQWIYNEMERPFNGNTNPTACDPNPECNPAPPRFINGPQNVCGTATYSASAIAGAVYNWTTSPAGAFSPATGSGPTFTTTGTGPNSGQVAVAVVSPCPSNSFTAALAVAVCQQFSVAITSLVYNSSCVSSTGKPNYALWTAAATGGNGPTTYAWYVDYSGTGNSFTGPVSNGTTFGTCLNGYTRIVQVKVVATNNGQQATALYYAQPQTMMAMYPNPADSYVDVANDAAIPSNANAANVMPQVAAASAAPAGTAPMQVAVYNGQGQTVFTATDVTAPSVRLNTQNWPDGLYQVNTQRGLTVTRRQLSVQHNH
ncbi:T9SS type A sorting domain-containing protein [Hymenobacter sp. PAMC 26628]|uniref:T9SS type A sorting domain-containing protein n=1 Tax=Hymenobacter sp. PAMC 26628 TaxID=1484118 RepID=UPI00077031C1|nr:T9SS type A sorting domain-containing protein [Hymenobacter sp. PAMC 26628]AMJ66104.1 hypothetical protein AXW84_12185 [Hymenobacter sp. PAMC 26628]